MKCAMKIASVIANGGELYADHCVSKIGGFGIQVDIEKGAGFFKVQRGHEKLQQDDQEKKKLDKIEPVSREGNGNDRIIVYDPVDCPTQ
jgi:hypothetical protein